MSISRQNLSVVIVSFFSEEVIHNCIKSIPEDVNILVVDNSGNKDFKESIERQYKNIKCLLSSDNLGMGSGNNLGLKNVSTDYAFILNPDVVLEKNAIDQLTKFEDDIKDNKSMIVENTQEIHQAFEAIMENTEFSRHTKETLTKRIMELYGPY